MKQDHLHKLLVRLPFLRSHPTWLRLAKFVIAALIIYFVAKAPLIMVMTELWGIHYVFSGFIVGAIITVLNFIPSEFWIWRKKK